MDGNIFNSRGVRVATVLGSSIFSPKGEKLYDLRGTKIYKLSGELVGPRERERRKTPRPSNRQAISCFLISVRPSTAWSSWG
jgi:hypothetical protein